MFHAAVVAAVAFYGPAAASDDASAQRTKMAKTLVAHMAAAQFDEAVEPFDQAMKGALPAPKLKEVWDGLVRQYGPLQQATEVQTGKIKQYEIVVVTCVFQRARVATRVIFDSADRVAGLFFAPLGEYRRPAYVDPSKFDEKEIQVGAGIWQLPGTLSVPKCDGPFPALILVHGSGPLDRDETIGPNKPFRDLAQGLASVGIAVLRYEKRTRQHPVMMALSANSITVKEETIDDAAAACETLASQDKIDPKRIFVLGHSLGGMLLPRIGRACDRFAGFISLAGSTRPLEDTVLEQTRYLLSLEGELTDEAQQKYNEVERQVARVKSPALCASTPKSELPLGLPPRYWLDLRGYDPPTAAKELPKPILILQGERDYQVTMDDFARWKRPLVARKDVTFISFPKLNHLFIEGEGKSTPAEYTAPGNVANVVVDEIAKWIKAIGAEN